VKIKDVFFASSSEVSESASGRLVGWVRALAVTAIAWAIGLTAATNAMALTPNCSVVTPVTESCGWVISAPGCYKLLNDLPDVSDSGDCITINSSNVYLDLNTRTIIGTGATSTGTGVHVLAQTIPGAVAITNVAVQGGTINDFFHGVFVGTVNAAGTPTKVRLDNITAVNNSQDDFDLSEAKLSQLSGLYGSGAGTGLAIDGGSGNRVSDSTFIGNVGGVFILEHSSGNILSAVNASSNSDAGIQIEQSTGNQISAASVDSNFWGILLSGGANGNTISGGHANSNQIGIKVEQSSGNQISGVEVNQNGLAGIYLGCGPPITNGTCDFVLPMSSNNGIDANINITSKGSGGSAYGIAIETGNKNNTIVGNTSSANATFDEYDGNVGRGNSCANNWFADNFGTSNASCVH
jgi:copper-binding protein NosD